MRWRSIALSAALCLTLAACGQRPEEAREAQLAPMRVSVVQARPGSLKMRLRLPGTLVARNDVAVSTALVGQKIVAVLAEVGQFVKRGQVLARLESVSVQLQLQQNEMLLKKAQAVLKARQSEWREAQITLQRYQPLARAGAISPQELDQQRMRMETAQANVQTAQAEIAQIRSLLADSRHQRAKAEIVAPVDGIISQRKAEAGALAGSDALFHIVRGGEIDLAVNAGAEDLMVLKAGMAAQVHIHGQNAPLNGKIRLLPPTVNASSRLGRVLVALDGESAKNLLAGMFGEAEFRQPEQSVAVSLPVQAVSFDGSGKAFVMLVDKAGQVMRREVALGRQQGGVAEIVSGVETGDTVVWNAAAFVGSGDVVAPVLADK